MPRHCVRRSGLRQQLRPRVGVVVVRFNVGAVAGQGGGRMHPPRGGIVEEHFVDGITVGGEGERLPHERVIEWRFVHVHADVEDGELGHRPIGVGQGAFPAEDSGQLDARDPGNVDLVVLEAGQQAATAERELHLIELGRAKVIAVVGDEDDLLKGAPDLQPEWAGAVGVTRPAVGIPLDLLLIDHVGNGVGELLEEIADGPLKPMRIGVFAHDLDAADLVRLGR